MSLTLYFLSVLGLLLGSWLLWLLRAKLRRSHIARLYSAVLKPEYIAILQRNVSLYARLPEPLVHILHGHINYFLDDKEFVGCNGQSISDEVRLTIAGNACLLILKKPAPIFSGFKTILVYPEPYRAQQTSYDGLVKISSHSNRAGESWHRGPIVLAWSDVLHGSRNEFDGHNVVLHEFAHKLDEENHLMDGLPILREAADYANWSKTLNREYGEFLARVEQHKNSVIDNYGATSAVEFFAVITESFFEKPQQMQRKLPALYEQLAHYFDLDPATWH